MDIYGDNQRRIFSDKKYPFQQLHFGTLKWFILCHRRLPPTRDDSLFGYSGSLA